MDWIPTIVLLLLLALMIVAFARSSWRRSERDYERYRSRRGEDEEEASDDRGTLRRHWGGWGRPGR